MRELPGERNGVRTGFAAFGVEAVDVGFAWLGEDTVQGGRGKQLAATRRPGRTGGRIVAEIQRQRAGRGGKAGRQVEDPGTALSLARINLPSTRITG